MTNSLSYRDRETLERVLEAAEQALSRVGQLELQVAELRDELREGRKGPGGDTPLAGEPESG